MMLETEVDEGFIAHPLVLKDMNFIAFEEDVRNRLYVICDCKFLVLFNF